MPPADRALGELDLADVVLREDDLAGARRLARVHEHEEALLAALDDAPGEGRREAVAPLHLDETGPVDEAGVEGGGDRVDQPGAADPLGRALADHVEAQIAVLDPDAVDGAGGPAHPVADLRALQRGAGGGGARDQALPGPHHDLAVRSDVDDGARDDALVQTGGQRRAHGVRADEAGDDREEADPRLGVDLEVQGPGRQHQRVSQDGGVGRETHVRRDRCPATRGACTCCPRPSACRPTGRARRCARAARRSAG